MSPENRMGWLVLAVVLSAAPLSAQVVTGALVGRVTDNTGAVIPGATVQVQNVETGLSRNAQSGAAGRYEVRNLPPGSYTVTVQQTGFQTLVRSGITLSVASEVAVNVELNVGAVAERVEVTAEAAAIETTNAAISNLVTPTQMRDLPLNGRSIDQLAMLTPGVVQQTNVNPGAFFGTGIRLVINGSRPTQVLYLLDGTVTNDYNMSGPGGVAKVSLGVEAVREFRILTHSYSAEYGRNSGGVFSSITRSGTNEFHGSAYEFVRNNIFDARDFFNLARAPNPSPLPPFRRNQFGASLGGRVVRDKVFFFLNYEAIRQRQQLAGVGTVPDLNARQGLLADPVTGVPRPVGPGPSNGINPVVVPYLNLFPTPNGPNLGGGAARYFRDLKTATTEDYSMARVDFNLSEKDSLYYRWVYDPSELVADAVIDPFVSRSTILYAFNVLSETHIFSPTALNEFRFAFNRTYPRTQPGPVNFQNNALDFLPGSGVMGTINFTGTSISTGSATAAFTAFGVGAGRDQIQNVFQATDTFSYVRGAHSLKFGADVQRLQANYRWTMFGGGPGRGGTYAFGSLADFLLGQPNQLQFPDLTPPSSPSRGWRQTVFGWFVQDDWRLRPNLTLNLGLRHEFITAPNEVNGKMARLPSLTARESIIGPPFNTSKTNFGPRVGLAWDPTGSGKTSVRAGFGMFYNLPAMGRIYDTSTFNYRFATTYSVSRPPGFPRALLSGFSPGLRTTRDVEASVQTPTSIHYNLEIARQLTSSIAVQVGYVGSHQYHLEQGPEANRAVGHQILPDGRKYFCSVPVGPPCPAVSATAPALPLINPNFGNIQWMSTPGWGYYNALQLGVQKRLSRGLQLQGSYTWSRATASVDQQMGGEASGQLVGPMDLDDLPRDYSLSLFHQTHVFTANGKYRMPWDHLLSSGVARALLGGWEINSIGRATTGLPFVIGAGFNVSRNRHVLAADRPDLNPGFSNNPSSGTTAGCTGVRAGQELGTPNLYFDPCAFSLPLAGTYGNLGRNTGIGPGVFNVDFGLVKNTALPWREGMNLEFRAEAFNLLNHANFRLPGSALFQSSGARNANGGRITGTATSNRQIQFGMKLIF